MMKKNIFLGLILPLHVLALIASTIEAKCRDESGVSKNVIHDFMPLMRYSYKPSDFKFSSRNDGSLHTESFQPEVVFNEIVVKAPSVEAASVATIPEEIFADSEEKVLGKIILGKDGRRPITHPHLWPHRVHARLNMTFNGKRYGGSGTRFDTVLTVNPLNLHFLIISVKDELATAFNELRARSSS
jgi:hypothetical protein